MEKSADESADDESPKDESPKDASPDSEKRREEKPLKSGKSYQYLRRELKEAELLNPGAVNLLVDEVMRLETEVDDLKPYKDRFHSADKRVAVLEIKSERPIWSEVVQTAALSVGSILIGASKQIMEMGNVGLVLLATGTTLTIATIAAKAFGWKK